MREAEIEKYVIAGDFNTDDQDTSDPSTKNISSRLGNGNKVRNFYGNIIDPNKLQ